VPDLYSTLGVARSASAQEIKKAYRKLAVELHPDKNPGDASEARFKEVTRAYEVLGDEKKRGLYDEFGDVSLQSGFDAERVRAARSVGSVGFNTGGPGGGVAFDLGDLFNARGDGGNAGFGDMLGDLFGRPRGGGRAVHAGADMTSTVRISFQDAVKGTTLELARRDGGAPISVRIPPGADDGTRLRVRGKGGPGHGGPAGDLILTLEVESHPHFTRTGDDLHLELPITPAEAYRGGQVLVPTPHGEVKLTIPKHAQSGQKVRLRGKGVARKRRPPGDLYVRFLIMLPEGDDLDIERAIDVLAKHATSPRGDIAF
jgi:curved DNA-binding protein